MCTNATPKSTPQPAATRRIFIYGGVTAPTNEETRLLQNVIETMKKDGVEVYGVDMVPDQTQRLYDGRTDAEAHAKAPEGKLTRSFFLGNLGSGSSGTRLEGSTGQQDSALTVSGMGVSAATATPVTVTKSSTCCRTTKRTPTFVDRHTCSLVDTLGVVGAPCASGTGTFGAPVFYDSFVSGWGLAQRARVFSTLARATVDSTGRTYSVNDDLMAGQILSDDIFNTILFDVPEPRCQLVDENAAIAVRGHDAKAAPRVLYNVSIGTTSLDTEWSFANSVSVTTPCGVGWQIYVGFSYVTGTNTVGQYITCFHRAVSGFQNGAKTIAI